jgi:hypothetical protein
MRPHFKHPTRADLEALKARRDYLRARLAEAQSGPERTRLMTALDLLGEQLALLGVDPAR